MQFHFSANVAQRATDEALLGFRGSLAKCPLRGPFTVKPVSHVASVALGRQVGPLKCYRFIPDKLIVYITSASLTAHKS